MTDTWLDSADYDAWRTTEDDGSDQDNSLGWTDGWDPLSAECPNCGDTLVVDEGDPDHGIAAGMHCDTCGWTG